MQAQLKLAENLRKMAEQGKDVEGMDIDLDALRAQVGCEDWNGSEDLKTIQQFSDLQFI